MSTAVAHHHPITCTATPPPPPPPPSRPNNALCTTNSTSIFTSQQQPVNNQLHPNLNCISSYTPNKPNTAHHHRQNEVGQLQQLLRLTSTDKSTKLKYQLSYNTTTLAFMLLVGATLHVCISRGHAMCLQLPVTYQSLGNLYLF